MKITKVVANNRKKAFVVHTHRRKLDFPYARAEPAPTGEDRIVRVYVDDELGREGFTYVLESGREGTLHIDHVLDYNEDPAYMAGLELYHFTIRVRELVEASSLSKRELVRRLGTSASQLYRLLDPTNYEKSMRQMLALLHVLGYEVEVVVRERSPRPTRSPAS